MKVFGTTILETAGILPGTALGGAANTRSNIFEMSQAAEDAVLRPKERGSFEHDLRAALAARVAHLSDDEALAAHYLADAGDLAILADPDETGETQGLSSIVAFVDKTANQTRDITADDISGLQAAGVADADIVRLCELVAFLAYQTRVVAGLRLMKAGAR